MGARSAEETVPQYCVTKSFADVSIAEGLTARYVILQRCLLSNSTIGEAVAKVVIGV